MEKGVAAHMQICEGLDVQVRNPFTQLVMPSCDKETILQQSAWEIEYLAMSLPHKEKIPGGYTSYNRNRDYIHS